MRRLRAWLIRLSGLFNKRRRERELSEELESHLQMHVEDNLRAGMSPAEARRQALIKLGGLEQVKENYRDRRGLPVIETLIQDIRYGLRQLRRNPGFTAVAVLTLALGIGANTAIFSVVEGVVLRPLPYKDPEGLLRIYQSNAARGYRRMMNSSADIKDARHDEAVFQEIAPFRSTEATLTGAGEPEQIGGATVPASFFRILGIQPWLGRVFSTEEEKKGHDQVVVISDTLWRERWEGQSDLAGKALTLDGKIYTVIGVMRAGFHFPREELPGKTDFWIPWTDEPEQRGDRDVAALARLKPGATVRQAQAAMDVFAERLERAHPEDKGWRFELVPMREAVAGEVKPAILMIFAAVGFVLLIACANVANLLLARAATRQKEMAIRSGLGAGRLRLIRQLLTESVLLSLAGGVLGLAVAYRGIHWILLLAPKDTPRLSQVGLNATVLVITAVTAIAVGILFGLVPALQASNPSLSTALKEGGGVTPNGFRTARGHGLRNLLVVSQVALTLVLTVGAGLMLKSFVRLTSVDLGFRPDGVLAFWVYLSGKKYESSERRLSFYEQTVSHMKALPGVESAALTSFLALEGYATTGAQIEGRPTSPNEDLEVGYKAISPDFFRVMGVPIVEGRSFSEDDRQGAPPVAIINRAFARRFYPRGDALGRRIHLDWGREPRWREVLAVAGDIRDGRLESEAEPEVYVPIAQAWVSPSVAFVVRSPVNPAGLAGALRHAIYAVDKDQPVSSMQTMQQILADTVAQPRFRTLLIVAFSLLALVLTAVGLYGVLAYSVSERTHEIGVRLALGAERADILKFVLKQGASLTFAGVALGLAGALALTRFVASFLYDVRADDPATFAGVSLLLVAVALLATYVPARRATKVDPMVALRYE
jgi:putative ABC transport system permease protein